MATAQKDDNGVPCWTGISCVDGVTPIRIMINPSTGALKVDDITAISVVPVYKPARDDNDFPITKGVSSSDGSTVLPLYVNPSTGAVLIDM